MRIATKTLSTAALLCLFVAGGGAAYAGTTNAGYDAIIPNLQQPWNSAPQTKQGAGVNGHVDVDYVGSDYTVNARLCNTGNGTCGSEVTDIGDNRSVVLSDSFGAGTTVHLQLHTSQYALVRVESVGNWRSN